MRASREAVSVDAREVTEVDVRSVAAALWKHRATVLVTAGGFVAAGLVYAFTATPVYQARLTVQIEDAGDAPASSNKGAFGELSSMFAVKPVTEGEIQMFTSNFVLARAADKLGLYVKAAPRYFPVIGAWFAHHADGLATPGVFGMGGFAWGREAIDVARFDVPQPLEGGAFKVEALANGAYRLSGPDLPQPVTGRVGAEAHFDTIRGTITLLVRRLDGEPGAVFDLTRQSRQRTVDMLQKSLVVGELGTKSNVLGAVLQGDDPVLISAALNEIGRQYVEQNAERKSAYAESSLRFLESELAGVKSRADAAETDYANYREKNAIVDIDEAGRQLLRQASDTESNLLLLRQKRQEMAVRFAPSHPEVAQIDGQIALAEQRMTRLKARIEALPKSDKGAGALMRDVRANTGLYAGLLNNMAELRLLKAGKIGTVRIIDPAEPPEYPVKPRKSMILALSALLGLFFGAGVALARNVFASGVTDLRALESETGLGIYATIPLSERQYEALAPGVAASRGQPMLLAARYPHDPAIESLRMLRTALQVAMNAARNNVVMLTGPLPGIGKSFVSGNLAAVLASGGQRVLVIDADMRRGHLHEQFGFGFGPGLADVLGGAAPFSLAVHRNVQPNLDLLATGLRPDKPAELLAGQRWRELIAQVSAQYDVVLIDAPAVLPVADAGIMAGSAGSIFLVARFAQTSAPEVAESMRALAQAGASVSGLLFNGVQAGSGYPRTYGSYTSFGYETTPQTAPAQGQTHTRAPTHTELLPGAKPGAH